MLLELARLLLLARFDEHLEDVIRVTHTPPVNQSENPTTLVSFNYDKSDTVSFVPVQQDFEITEGILSFKYEKDTSLVTGGSLSLEKSAFGEIELHMKVMNPDSEQSAHRRAQLFPDPGLILPLKGNHNSNSFESKKHTIFKRPF